MMTTTRTRAAWPLLTLILAVLTACAPRVTVTPLSAPSEAEASSEIDVYRGAGVPARPYREVAGLSASRVETDFSPAWLEARIVDEARGLGADAVILYPLERRTETRRVVVGYQEPDDIYDTGRLRFGGGQGDQDEVVLTLRGVAIVYTDPSP